MPKHYKNLKNSYHVETLDDTLSQAMMFKAKQTVNILMACVMIPISWFLTSLAKEELQNSIYDINFGLIIFLVLISATSVIFILQCFIPATVFIDRNGISLSRGMAFKPKVFKWSDIHEFTYRAGRFSGRTYIPPMLSIHEKGKIKPSYTIPGKFHQNMEYFTEKLNDYADQHDGSTPYIHCHTLVEQYRTYNKKILITVSILFFGFYATYAYFKLF